jgi:hypothetical protein
MLQDVSNVRGGEEKPKKGGSSMQQQTGGRLLPVTATTQTGKAGAAVVQATTASHVSALHMCTYVCGVQLGGTRCMLTIPHTHTHLTSLKWFHKRRAPCTP